MSKPKPPKVDRDRIRAEEQGWLNVRLDGVTAPDKLLAETTRIIARAEREFDKLKAPRDQAGLSLSLYDGVRAVHDVIGVSRTYWFAKRAEALGLDDDSDFLSAARGPQIAARAAERGVPRVNAAAQEAVRFGEKAVRQEERADLARRVRDEAVRRLAADPAWSRGDIAKIAKFNESRVSQIVGDALPVAS